MSLYICISPNLRFDQLCKWPIIKLGGDKNELQKSSYPKNKGEKT